MNDKTGDTIMGWQPMVTAPRDGRKIILGYNLVHAPYIVVSSFNRITNDEHGEWTDISPYVTGEPQAWVPIPPIWSDGELVPVFNR